MTSPFTITTAAEMIDGMTEYDLIMVFQAVTTKTKEDLLRALESAALQQG